MILISILLLSGWDIDSLNLGVGVHLNKLIEIIVYG